SSARIRAHRGEPPALVTPDEGAGREGGVVRVVDVDAERLAQPARSRLSQAGGDRDHDRGLAVCTRDLELAALRNGALVDVAGENELRAGGDEPAEHVVSTRDGPLARAPRGTEQVMVEDGDPERTFRRLAEQAVGAGQLRVGEPPGLVSPRPDRVQADDDETLAAVHGLRRPPDAFELGPGLREAG